METILYASTLSTSQGKIEQCTHLPKEPIDVQNSIQCYHCKGENSCTENLLSNFVSNGKSTTSKSNAHVAQSNTRS